MPAFNLRSVVSKFEKIKPNATIQKVYLSNMMECGWSSFELNGVLLMTKSEYFVLSLMTIMGLGFIDILWMFGVENSKKNILGGMFFIY